MAPLPPIVPYRDTPSVESDMPRLPEIVPAPGTSPSPQSPNVPIVPGQTQQPFAGSEPQPFPSTPGPTASESAAAASSGFDFSRSLADSGSRSSGGAGSDLVRNAVEFQGDNFGPGAGLVTVSQVFNFSNVAGFNVGGGLYAFEVGTDSYPNDLYTNVPLSGTPLSATLDEPINPTDAPMPTEPGFEYAGGTATQSGNLFNLNYAYTSQTAIVLPSSVTGRMKLAENVSPMPQDRFFMSYSSFNNVPLSANGISVNRFTPGFERTFWNKLASIEIRTPFATTLDSNILTDGTSNTNKAEFGNLFFTAKGLLLASDAWGISAGLSLTAPTADDNRIISPSGTELLRVKNGSVHLLPFIAGLSTPTPRSFIQGIFQIDIDSNGNEVLARTSTSGLQAIGRFHDSTFMYCDVSMGYWLMRRGSRDYSFIRGIIPMLEGHWNRSLNDSDEVRDANSRFVVRPPVTQLDVLNILTGVTFQLRNRSRLACGYVVPVGNGADRVFDSELRVTWNKYFL